MITKKEIEKVEEIQKLQREIGLLKEDYSNIRFNVVGIEDSHSSLNYNYNKPVKIAIRNRIRIVQKKINKLLEESE